VMIEMMEEDQIVGPASGGKPREVLVRVVASGICQTDVHARDGYFPVPWPAVYGHEGTGVVERVGAAVKAVAPGDHVIMASPACGDRSVAPCQPLVIHVSELRTQARRGVWWSRILQVMMMAR